MTDDLAALAALPPALARLCLQRLAGDGAPALAARAPEILALGLSGSASLDLGGGLRAVAEYGRLRFERGGPLPAASPARLAVPGGAAFAGGRLTCEVGADLPPGEGTLDLDALAAPLEVRAWEAGDRMRPLGLGGSRSLQDLFTDRRVPRARRSRTPVVVSGGEIAWVPGVATGRALPGHVGHPPPRADRLASARRLDCAAVLRDEAIGEILVQADELQHRVRALGAEISRDYEGKDLLLVGVLKGAVFFLSDLMRHIDVPCEVDFMAVASYGSSTDSSGVVRILKDLDAPLEGRDVLIVEDIVDSGLTLQYLLRTPGGAQARLAGGLRAADQARPAEDRPPRALHRVRDPRQVRDRLRPGLRRALPQPALRRRVDRCGRLTRGRSLGNTHQSRQHCSRLAPSARKAL